MRDTITAVGPHMPTKVDNELMPDVNLSKFFGKDGRL